MKREISNKEKERSKKRNCLNFTYLSIFLFLFFIQFVSAVPPVTTIDYFPQGYTITEAQQSYLQVNHSYRYHFLVNNASNGVEINDSYIKCDFIIQDLYGNPLQYDEATYIGSFWEFNITAETLSNISQYAYAINCNNTNGAVLAGTFETTETGLEINETVESNTRLGLIFLLSIMGITLFIVYLNKKEEYYLPLIAGMLFMLSGIFCFTELSIYYDKTFVDVVGIILVGLGLFNVAESIWRFLPDDR